MELEIVLAFVLEIGIAGGEIWRVDVGFEKARVFHSSRLEDVATHIIEIIFSRHFLNDRSQYDVTGVAVLHLFAGLERQRLVDEQRKIIPGLPENVLAADV